MTPFERFWNAYPRRDGKGAALKAWNKTIKGMSADELEAFTTKIILALIEQKKFRWDKTERQYIPMGSTWINQCRWEDEIPSQTQKEKSQGGIRNCPCGNESIFATNVEPICALCVTKKNNPTFKEKVKENLRNMGFTKDPGESWKEASFRCLKANNLSSMIPKVRE